MDPLDFRTAAFKDLQDRLQGLRMTVLNAWREHGPGTTREVAAKAKIDILTFRPRSTELLQLGILKLAEEQPGGHEGVYRALSDHQIHAAFLAHQEAARNPQLVLKL